MTAINMKVILICIVTASAVVAATPPVEVLVGTASGIYKVVEDGDDTETLYGRRCYALDYNYAAGKLYVATDDKIVRLSLGPRQVFAVAVTVVNTETRVTSLAVDWVADTLYYVSDQRGAVRVHSLAAGQDTNAEDVVVVEADSKIASPGWDSLAVDPYARKLFWLGSGGLYSSELTGEGLNVTSFATGLTPYRLSVDIHSQTIYLMAGATGGLKLLRCSYDGTGMKEILKIPHTESKVYGFGIIGNVAYWESNFDGENIYKANITSEGSSTIISTVYEINKIVNDVKIFHRDLQRPKENVDVEIVSSQNKLHSNERIQRIG